MKVGEAQVDTGPNCGNMLAGVALPFAIEAGLVAAQPGRTTVRIHNVNTGTLIEASVETPHGTLSYEGDTRIDGVPGSAAPIRLTFLDAAGALTGRLFPTGRTAEEIDGIRVTCIDMAMPLVLLDATALGKAGRRDAGRPGRRPGSAAAAGVDPDRGRPAHGAGRRLRAGGAEAGPAVAALARWCADRPLLHAGQLPHRPGRDRWRRHRHRLRHRRHRRCGHRPAGALAGVDRHRASLGPAIDRPGRRRCAAPSPMPPSSAPRGGCSRAMSAF